jgi:hypothetical protein
VPDFTGAVVLSNAPTAWIFDSGVRVASSGGTGNLAESATFTAEIGNTVNVECYYAAGTSPNMRLVVKNDSGTLVRFGGSAGIGNYNGQSAQASTGGTSIQTFSETLVTDSIYKGAMQFAANYTGNHFIKMLGLTAHRIP